VLTSFQTCIALRIGHSCLMVLSPFPTGKILGLYFFTKHE